MVQMKVAAAGDALRERFRTLREKEFPWKKGGRTEGRKDGRTEGRKDGKRENRLIESCVFPSIYTSPKGACRSFLAKHSPLANLHHQGNPGHQQALRGR